MLGAGVEHAGSRSSSGVRGVRGVRVFGLSLVVTLAGACNLLNGSGDLAVGEAPFGGTQADGGRADGAAMGGDGGTGGDDGGGTTGDGGSDLDAGIIDPKLSSCGTNQICLPDVAGWSPAIYLAAAGPKGNACPATYPQQNTLQQSGGGSCACVCSANNGSCDGTLTTKSGALCGGAPADLGVLSGSCSAVAATLPLPVSFTAHPIGMPPASCGATVTNKLNAPRPGTYCSGAVTSAGMCAPGEACVTKPSVFTGGFACIVHDGDIACPKNLFIRMTFGTAVTDGRSCGNTCSCAPAPCGGTIEAFSDGACATSVRSVAADGTCITAGAAMTGASYLYTASSGCGVSTPAQVLGSETYTGQKTLCCAVGF